MEAHRLERDFHTASYECHLIQSDSQEAIWKRCTFFVPHQFITNVLVVQGSLIKTVTTTVTHLSLRLAPFSSFFTWPGLALNISASCLCPLSSKILGISYQIHLCAQLLSHLLCFIQMGSCCIAQAFLDGVCVALGIIPMALCLLVLGAVWTTGLHSQPIFILFLRQGYAKLRKVNIQLRLALRSRCSCLSLLSSSNSRHVQQDLAQFFS